MAHQKGEVRARVKHRTFGHSAVRVQLHIGQHGGRRYRIYWMLGSRCMPGAASNTQPPYSLLQPLKDSLTRTSSGH